MTCFVTQVQTLYQRGVAHQPIDVGSLVTIGRSYTLVEVDLYPIIIAFVVYVVTPRIRTKTVAHSYI